MTNPSSKVGERPKAERFYVAEDNAGDYYFRLAEVPLMHESYRKVFEYVLASEYEAQAAEIERLTAREKQWDAIVDEESIANSCINPMEDLRIGICKLKLRAVAAEASNASLVERVGKLEKLLNDVLGGLSAPLVSQIRAALAPAEEKKA